MTTDKYVFFWGGEFSQWFPSKFIIANKQYLYAEQWMMAEKARAFNDIEMLDKIMASKEPRAMKGYGRLVKNYDEDVWSKIRYEVVVKGNLAKFSQNDSLRNILLNTNDKILVEASPHDTIWGIGLGDWNEDILDESKWRGQNLLGKALMEVREKLKADDGVCEAKKELAGRGVPVGLSK